MKREVHHPNTPTIATFSFTNLPSKDIICCTCVVKLSEANLDTIKSEKNCQKHGGNKSFLSVSCEEVYGLHI